MFSPRPVPPNFLVALMSPCTHKVTACTTAQKISGSWTQAAYHNPGAACACMLPSQPMFWMMQKLPGILVLADAQNVSVETAGVLLPQQEHWCYENIGAGNTMFLGWLASPHKHSCLAHMAPVSPAPVYITKASFCDLGTCTHTIDNGCTGRLHDLGHASSQRGSFGYLTESLKDQLLLVFGNAAACVLHTELHHVHAHPSCRQGFHRHPDVPLCCELQGVTQQVEDDLQAYRAVKQCGACRVGQPCVHGMT